jgi:hypothetical protein
MGMNEQNLSEYLVKCPTCQTQTKMICEESSPVVVICEGCERALVMHENKLFTVPVRLMLDLMRVHRVRSCGNIVATKISDEAQSMLSDKKITGLHDLLQSDVDVLDIIRSL